MKLTTSRSIEFTTSSEVEAALRGLPTVDDCAVLERARPNGGCERVAYVVPNGVFEPQQIATQLAKSLAPGALPTCYVPLLALPLTTGGKLDEDRLRSVEVYDDHLIERWETQLQKVEAIEHGAVLVQEFTPVIPPLHLSELLPDWRQTSTKETKLGVRGAFATPALAVPNGQLHRPTAISHGATLRPVASAPATLPETLRRAARQTAIHSVTYLRADGSDLEQSYSDLQRDAETILRGLRKHGLKPGDKVLLQLDQNQDFIPAFWGCVLGGFVPVPISIAPTYEQVNSALTKLHNAWLIFDQPLIVAGSRLAPAVRGIAGLLKLDGFRVADVEELRRQEPDTNWHAAQPGDVALMMLTSGSTGLPKGVMLTHRNLLARSMGSVQMNGFTASDVSLNWMPLDHVAGIIYFHLRDVYLGCRQIHAPTQIVLQDPLKWLDWIERFRATSTFAPNFAFGLVNDRADQIAKRKWDLASMRFVLNGAEAIVAKTARRFLQLLLPHGLSPKSMRPAWGMSETSSGVTYGHFFTLESTSDDDSFVEVGAPIPGVSLRIVDAHDQPIEEDAIGQLQVGGTTLMAGYYANEALNREVFRDGGWFNTGDLGFLREGRLTITGREKDVIIINGVNYYSHEIEGVVEEISGVTVSFTAACAVRDAGDDTEKLAIFFNSSRTEARDLKNLLSEIRRRVNRQIGVTPGYLLPVARTAIPKTEIGKIQRTQLKQRFEDGEFSAILKRADLLSANANTLPNWFFAPIWRAKELRPASRKEISGRILIFTDQLELGRILSADLSAAGCECVMVESGDTFCCLADRRFALNPASTSDYERLFESLHLDQKPLAEIFHFWTCNPIRQAADDLAALRSAQALGSHSLLNLTKALAKFQSAVQRVGIHVVSECAQPVAQDEQVAWAHAPLLGLVKTIPLEWPQFDCRHLDLDDTSTTQAAGLILCEAQAGGDREVAYRGGRRFIPRLRPVDLAAATKVAAPFKRGGIYLISGGLGGVGVAIARWLLEKFQARVLLLGRTPLPVRSEWEKGLERGGSLGERINSLRSLEQCGGAVRYEAGDVADSGWLRALVRRAETDWAGELDGIIHLAGAYHDNLLAGETSDSWDALLRPKIEGAWALHQLVKDRPGRLVIHFSSAISFFGGAMVGAYTAANRFLESFSRYQRNQCKLRSYCFSWSTWNETGMSRGYAGKDPLRARGFQDLAVEQGIQSLLAALHADEAQLFIGLNGANAFLRRHLESSSIQSQQLTAFHSTRNGQVEFPALAAPEIPDRFGVPTRCECVAVENMPLTANGDIDRGALADLARRIRRGGVERVAPRTQLEHSIAGVWQTVLKTPTLGVFDNFFELGGNSLLATQVTSRLRDVLKIEVALRTLFERPTVASLAESLQSSVAADEIPATPLLGAVARAGDLPLSFAQQRLWFMDRLEPSGAADNTPCAFRIQGALDVPALERSLEEIIRRHETLRTTFPSAAGRPRQLVAPAGKLALPIIDLDRLTTSASEAEALRLGNEEARRPFNLAEGPLLRLTLLRLDDHDHVLLATMHHIISDGWSLGVFTRELAALFEAFSNGKPSPLADLPVQYADFSVWQRNGLQGSVLEKQLAYWKQQLAGVPLLLELPTDRPRPPAQTYRGARQHFTIPRRLAEEIKTLTQREGATLFMTLMAAFQTVLHRYSRQEQLIVSTAIANRNRQETESLIGCLINVLLLRADFGGNPTFRELLARVRETALEAYAHQDLPFEKLVEELQPARDLSYNPLTQVMFVLLNAPKEHLELAGLDVKPLGVETGATQYDIIVHVFDTSAGLTGFVDFSTDLFDAETIARMFRQFEQLLTSAVTNPDERVESLTLLPAAERARLLGEWNATGREFPRAAGVHELFAAQAARGPDAVAVEFEGARWTYRELNARANQLAHHLRALGVGPDVLVGLCVERSLDLVAGVLGILKAGGAYVPLDPAYPPERLAFMLADAQAPVLLTQASLAENFAGLAARVVCLDADWPAIAPLSAANPPPLGGPEDLAYVIYTSGSTGQPKGVEIPHSAVVNFLASMRREPGLRAGDTLLAVTTLSFDIAGLELHLPLTTGAKVVLASRATAADGRALQELLAASGANVMQATPATWRLLLEAGWGGDARLKILCGGEALPRSLADQLLPRCGELWNVYGPTETTIWSTLARVGAGAGPLTIGRPIANTTIYIVDAAGQPAPIGVPGELLIGGAGVARGYRNRPELTAEKFAADPFRAAAGGRVYRTGDLARWRADGTIEFLGRLDFQVKVRGFRIELGEIETVLAQHPAVQQCVVAAPEGAGGEKRLVAYYVAAAAEANAGDLRAHVKARLPEHMVPALFVRLEKFPLTPNGKIDRQALKLPDDAAPELTAAYVAPRTPVEAGLAKIWAEVLEVKSVGVETNFFDLGGHSLLATRVVSRINKVFQAMLPIRSLFEKPTVAGLAEELKTRETKPGLTGKIAHVLQRIESMSAAEKDARLQRKV